MSYASTDEHVADELARVDSLLLAYARTGGQSPERLSELLQDRPRRGGRTAIEPSAETIRKRVAETGPSTRLRFAEVADRFGLSRVQTDILALGLAPDLDERYERAFGALQGDTTMRRPTVGLNVAILRAAGHGRLDTMRALSPESTLLGQRLLDIVERGVDTPFRSRILSVDRRVLSYLLGATGPESVADGLVQRRDPDPATDVSTLPERVGDRVERAVEATDGPTLYVCTGPAGGGPERVARAVCSRRAVPLLRVEAADLQSDRVRLSEVLREARLEGAALQVAGVGKWSDQGSRAIGSGLLDDLDGLDAAVFLTGRETESIDRQLSHEVVQIAIPRPDHDRRREIWEGYASALPATVDPSELAATFRLTQGQIDDAITAARNSGISETITEPELHEACTSQIGSELPELARKLEPAATWDDIHLPEATARRLRAVATRITGRGRVYDEWGLGEQFTRGTGVVALFAGPSGTGKTMAAEVLANDSGMELYKIDLSTVVSKYIGETEENLEAIFQAAENSSSILLFDEADAIFGERSSVSDSTDRYANAEVNYLLQRIERYDGVVLLTTNYDQHIDDAFQRRIDLTVDFPRPGPAVRRRLWKGLLSGAVPTGEVDHDFLATLELTGGGIKNAVQSAAFRAAERGCSVGMEQLLPAIRREYDKSGRLLDPGELGEYQALFAE